MPRLTFKSDPPPLRSKPAPDCQPCPDYSDGLGGKKVSVHKYVCFGVLNANSSLTSCIRIFIYHWRTALRSHAGSQALRLIIWLAFYFRPIQVTMEARIHSNIPSNKKNYDGVENLISARWSSVRFLIWSKSSRRETCTYMPKSVTWWYHFKPYIHRITISCVW